MDYLETFIKEFEAERLTVRKKYTKKSLSSYYCPRCKRSKLPAWKYCDRKSCKIKATE